jgi:lambda repressor-like predicted transcriptional regulator
MTVPVEAIIAVARANPDWTRKQVAAAVGTSAGSVHRVLTGQLQTPRTTLKGVVRRPFRRVPYAGKVGGPEW